ncbi:MAG TPA: hypothetical protein VFA26_00095 [Gemmataceae bacterium]|jgi:hypothetical protein|nr:hypothetical protein [Gemmataceae bacterium]
MTRIGIRWYVRRDAPDILRIAALRGLPLDDDELCRFLRQPCNIGMVAEADGDAVVGFLLYTLGDRCTEIAALGAESPAASEALLAKVESKLSRRRRRAQWDVPERDTALLVWLRSRGWRAVGMLRGKHGENDAVRMVKWRDGAAEEGEPTAQALNEPHTQRGPTR